MSNVHILDWIKVCDDEKTRNDERPSMELDFHKKNKTK